MSAKSEKILRDFTQSLTQPKGTSAYDTTAKVLRVENGTAWVHIPGGVDETPVKLTIDAKEGDVVQVRVSGGRAFLIGNATSPPTDDAAANAANKRAVNADKKAGVARQTAEEADGKATEAKEIAEEAGEAVAEVAQHFWTDEDGAHITEVTQEEYIDDPESAGSNTLLDSDGMYIRDGVTNKASFGLVTRIGEEDKARIEITDESFKQVTDNDVTAVDIQSSGATAETTIIRERMQHVYIPQTTRRSNSDSREAVATILANIYDTDSLIDVSYAPVTFTWGWGASKSQAQETLHTLVCEITDTSLEEITVTHDGQNFTVLSLTELPLTVTATGAGDGGTTTIAVERAEDYHVERPDETEFDGYEGETVLLRSQTGEGEMEFGLADITGALDDGATYRIVAVVSDSFGQKATDSIEFEVHWEHQALAITAITTVENGAVKITPSEPTGALATDTADIYRLSADRPQLIYKDAELGETYVDPYPTLGDYWTCFDVHRRHERA